MLTETPQAEELGAKAIIAPYSKVGEDAQAGRTSDVEVISISDAPWVDHVYRIHTERDQTAFRELFNHFAPRVKAFLMRSGASEALAEECTQEVMATLWNKPHLFNPERASVAPWIFTIARNRKIDALRKQRRPEPEDLTWGPEAEPDQADVMVLQQECSRLSAAVKSLPDKQRELIERAFFSDQIGRAHV
mgnify:FL=1